MASTQKKPTSKAAKSSSGGNKSGGGKSGGKGPKAPAKRKAPAYQPDMFSRGIAATICAFLALMLILGIAGINALVVDFICVAVKGLIGYGFWLAPFALVMAVYLLLFQRQRRLTVRLWCIGLLPLFFGALLHLSLSPYQYEMGVAAFSQLGRDGGNLLSGGMLGGALSVSFSAWFSKLGAGLIFVLVLLVLLAGAFHLTPARVMHFIQTCRERAVYQAEYEEEYDDDSYVYEGREEDEEEFPLVQARTAPPPPPRMRRERRRKAADLPLDDLPPLPQEDPDPDDLFLQEEAPEEQPPKKERGGRFKWGGEKSPEVPPPEPLPVVEEPEWQPITAAPPPPEPVTPPPPAAPPLPTKAQKKEELRQAEAEVAGAIQQNLEDTPKTYLYPPLDLLTAPSGKGAQAAQEELEGTMERLSGVLKSFGIDGQVVGAVQGPSVTRYEIALKQGVRLNKLTNLSDDVALALGVASVRIAPVPDKISMVGVEVPNKNVIPVNIREVLSAPAFQRHKSSAAFSVGKDIGGNYIVGDCAKLPHMLIAGTTGSGKSVCINSLIVSMLYKSTPEELRLIMVDPKMVELGGYNGIPHLLIPVVTDPKKAAGALQWAVTEMMKRYRLFSEAGVRELTSYNHWAREQENVETMPKIVIVIDELADLMLVAAKEVEESICRVAQMGRAAGMHLVIATQRPSADVITGLMKANIPSRVAFAVASSLESRIILDNTGAEKLVGKGDMLWFPLGSGKPLRVQGCFISDEEVAAVVDCVKQNSTAAYDDDVMEQIEQHVSESEKKGSKSSSSGGAGAFPAGESGGDGHDELFPAAVDVIMELGQASVSMLQRRLKLGYARAARLVDQMEEEGIVGPFEGSKPRQLLITKEQWESMKNGGGEEPAQEAPPPVEEEILSFEAVPQSFEP